jgi:hypothetical protein
VEIKRLPFVVVGLVIAGLAVLLVLWGLSAMRSEPAGSNGAIADSAADATPEGDGASAAKSRPWQAFTGGAAHSPEQAAALRPIERLERAAGRPFDQAYAQKQLERLGLHLEGIGRGEQPLALISGRVLRIGDRIEGYRVASIERTGVLLIGPNGMRLDLAPQLRSAARRSLPAGSGGQGGDGGGIGSGGQQGSVWRSEDGLRALPYFPDGRPDIRPTDPNIKLKKRLEAENLPWDRSKPWPQGPFPQPPSAYVERERKSQER